jgi:hypothetical protein
MVEDMVHCLHTMLTLISHIGATAFLAVTEDEITPDEQNLIYQAINHAEDGLRSALAWLRW